MGGFMSGRGTTNLLTRTTAILGTAFFAISLALALLNRGTMGTGRSLLDTPPPLGTPAGTPAPSAPAPAPAPAGPSVPTQG
jgi:preprotein translocase subunit SecG